MKSEDNILICALILLLLALFLTGVGKYFQETNIIQLGTQSGIVTNEDENFKLMVGHDGMD